MIFERVKIGGKLHREEKDGVELGQVGRQKAIVSVYYRKTGLLGKWR
jgi:hypothetical protein